MLTSTFLHAPGIGAATEKRIWEAGVSDWQRFLEMQDEIGLPERQMSLLLPIVEESVDRFACEDYNYFANRLPNREHWRAFGELGQQAAFLDIETTGTYLGAGITVIGIYDGETTRTFVKGFNLEEFADEVEKRPLLITYAGAMFDLPHLRHAFPGTKLNQLHLDLCPTLRRIGYKGGLKHIEEELGICRSEGVVGLCGWDAVRLWHEWENGSQEALATLVEYNRADVENLKPLAELVYDRLRAASFPNR
jgi:uncharacterized protein YprB with RNaseH-like and TPR domain